MLDKPIWKIHPGEILREEFLKPFGLTAYSLAKALHVPPIRMNDIVNEKRSISVDTALRLSKYFGNTPYFWLNLQATYDLKKTFLAHEKEINEIKAYSVEKEKALNRPE